MTVQESKELMYNELAAHSIYLVDPTRTFHDSLYFGHVYADLIQVRVSDHDRAERIPGTYIIDVRIRDGMSRKQVLQALNRAVKQLIAKEAQLARAQGIV